MTLLLIIAGWLICSVLSYGILFAHAQREFPFIAERDYRKDMAFSMALGLFGPFILVASIFLTGFAQHGLKFR